jgi:hypothetical protein
MFIIFWRGLERAFVRRGPGRPCPADTVLSNTNIIEIDANLSLGKARSAFRSACSNLETGSSGFLIDWKVFGIGIDPPLGSALCCSFAAAMRRHHREAKTWIVSFCTQLAHVLGRTLRVMARARNLYTLQMSINVNVNAHRKGVLVH